MLFLIGFAFALTFVFNKLATTNGVPFIPYVAWQAFGGGLILLLVCFVRKQLPQLGRKHIALYFLTGIFNVSLPICVLSFVAPKVPSGILSLGLMLIPLLIYGLALVLGMDRFDWIRFFGILFGFAGVLVILLPKASLPSPDLVGWVALGLVAPLCYAFGAIIMASFRIPAARSFPLACGLLLAAAVSMVAVVALTDSWWFFDGRFDIGPLAVIGAMIDQAVIFVLMFEIIRRAGPVFFSPSNYIAVFLGVMIGILFFGDRLSTWIWFALVLMIAGLFCVNLKGRIVNGAVS